MNIYFVSQDVNNGYDTFDSFVVVAKDEEDARYTFPGYMQGIWNGKKDTSFTWCDAEEVKVEHIGTAGDWYTKKTIICTSFNAG